MICLKNVAIKTVIIKKKKKPLTFEALKFSDNNKTIRVRTGLLEEEFAELLDLMRAEPEPIKRGPKLLDLDLRLVIILQWLQLGQTYEQLSFFFGLTSSQIQTAITSLWDPLAKVLTENYIPKSPLDYISLRKFRNHEDAVGALDATLLPVVKPKNPEENRDYFSGKHSRHGVKLQALAAPDGTCIHIGGIVEGRRNDFYLYQQSNLARIMGRPEHNEYGERIITRPPILADGGYLGIRTTYPEAIIPIRKPPNQHLTPTQKESNRLLSQDRVIVERFFGRLKLYWGILQKPYRCDRGSMFTLIKICVGLTNLKIKRAPLFAEEEIFDPDEPPGEEEEESEIKNNNNETFDVLPSSSPPLKISDGLMRKQRGKKSKNQKT